MRKPIFPRIFLIALLYVGIFILLVSVQFAGHVGFTIRVGDFVVSGQHREPSEDDLPGDVNKYFLDGNVHILFGGMDFGIGSGSGGRSLHFVGLDGARVEVLPESMLISESSAQFLFPGGTELIFASHYVGDFPEMRITGAFSEDVAGIELPFTPQRRTSIWNAGNGQFIAVAGGINYSFGNSPMDIDRRMLLVNAGGRAINYRAIPDRLAFSPYDFILPQAETAEAFNEVLTRWRDGNFNIWNRAVSTLNNEDIVLAHLGEAFTRGTYRAAVAAVPASFLGGNARTFQSSVYLGGLDQAYLSLIAADREKLAILSRQIDEMSPQFLIEPRVFEFFATRGHNNLFAAASNVVRAMDPDTLYLDIVPGILEGYMDWRTLRPGTENPFDPLMDQVFFVISDSLRRAVNTPGNQDSLRDLVFVVYNDQGETEFNLRLGLALSAYAESVQDQTWAGIGRSLVLSALSMGDASGPELSARLSGILRRTDVYPRAVNVGAPAIWAWTASNEVSAVQQNDILNISVGFPAGESHYMIIRGIQPFVRLQLYNIDYRSDPQFERFDSSGWRYIPQEQTLLVKMRHRVNVENIRIIFREAPRPIVVPEPVQEDPGNNVEANDTTAGNNEAAGGGNANAILLLMEGNFAP
jgi:hypothetical protein